MDRASLIAAQIPRLRRYARALLRDPVAADDLVQDTLERAWRKLPLWRPGSDLRAWLFAIMHNVFVNQVRVRRVEPEPWQDEEGPPAAGLTAEASQLRDLERCLARLSDEQREVLLLVGLEQLTYEETARALGIPIGTVMSRLSRARERLRRLMGGEDEPPALKVVK